MDRDIEGHFIRIKGSILMEDIAVTNVCMPNSRFKIQNKN